MWVDNSMLVCLFSVYFLLSSMIFYIILELIDSVLVILSLTGDQPFDNGGKELWWLEYCWAIFKNIQR